METGASHYPIVQLLNRTIAESGLTPTGFVVSLGYRTDHLERGLNRLSLWLLTGAGHLRILRSVAATYPAFAAAWEKAVAATEALRRAEAKAAWIESLKATCDTFTPYLHVDGETRWPSSITIFGMVGGKTNLIPIEPSVLALGVTDQLHLLPVLMLEYLDKHKGQCPFFGKVQGFRFVRCLDYFRFDAQGRYLEHVREPFRRGEACVSLK